MTKPTDLSTQVLELALAIQQIPAPTFWEAKRAAFMRDRFRAEGLSDVAVDKVGNVFGRLPGSGQSSPLVVSAHLDTVFPADQDLKVSKDADSIFGPGIGDNAVGVASLCGLLWGLRQRGARLPGDIWFVANVGEEGLGDLCGMRAVVERFGAQVCAYLVLEGMALGQIYHQGLGVQRYRITARTAGGHSWVDYGQPSAIHELATIITQLTAIPLPKTPRTTLNIGVFQGGTSINTIAAEAHLELDLRSVEAAILGQLVKQVQAVIMAAHKPAIQISIKKIGQRPIGQLSTAHPLVLLAERCLEATGVQPRLNIGSTDANIPLSQGLPAICIGLTTGSGAHTMEEYIHTRPLAKGLAQLVNLAEQAFWLPTEAEGSRV